MDGILSRFWHDLVERTTGPMWFRIVLQPLVAVCYGVRAGLANSRAAWSEQPPPDLGNRRRLFRQSLAHIGKVFAIGLVLDVVFQLIALRTLHPLEGLFVAFLLVVVPYVLLRAVVGSVESRR